MSVPFSSYIGNLPPQLQQAGGRLRNFWAKAYQIYSGSSAQINYLVFGDSVGPRIPKHTIPLLSSAYGGVAGLALGVAHTGYQITVQTSGSVVTPDGGTHPYDYTYWPTGDCPVVSAGGTVSYNGAGSVWFGDSFKVYYVRAPGAGTITIDLLDGSNSIISTQTVSAANATVTGGIVTFSGAGVVGRKLKVTGISGSVTLIGASYVNSTVPGIMLIGVNRGGLSLTDANSANADVLDTVIGDIAPDWATFEMRETSGAQHVTDITAHISRFATAHAAMDWIYVLSGPSSQDDGFNGASNCPTRLENAETKAAALSAGQGIFDTFVHLVSYETVVSLNWQNDGVHLADAAEAFLASLQLHQFGLLDFLGAKQPRSFQVTTGGVTGSLTIGAGTSSASPFNGKMAATGFGQDVDFSIDRAFMIKDLSGTPLVNFQVRNGSSFLPGLFTVGAAGVQINNNGTGSQLGFTTNANADAAEIYARYFIASGSIIASGSGGVNSTGLVRSAAGLGAPMTTPATTLTTPGTVTKWMMVYDENGSAIGYVPVFNITP